MVKLTNKLEPGEDAPEESRAGRIGLLALTALGVVFGDIGTSPLYAFRECFWGSHSVEVSPENVLGVMSLIFWALILIISVKYLLFIMQADNNGEGGVLALMALIHPSTGRARGGRAVLVAMGLFGAALLYGDGTLTPAISVLSAVEGLEVATPVFEPYVVPLTVVILLGLFLFQRRGTAGVGKIFGPVMLVWFVAIGATGIASLAASPGVLAALSPHHAVTFFAANGMHGFAVLGAVFLVVTGGEALYADMGHFGRKPIKAAWFALVLPALLLSYLGQAALLLERPDAARNPFYLMAPGWALYPLVVLSTMATVIASQAVISGAFSLTRQAVQLDYSPYVRIRHTSTEEIGQVFIPAVNWSLMIVTIGLVLAFRRSTHLAGAYGIAVATTMVVTTILAYRVAREKAGWSLLAAGGLASIFLAVDLGFMGANLLKIFQGGWFPIVLALAVFIVMKTWHDGRHLIRRAAVEGHDSMEKFIEEIRKSKVTRVPGSAVFLTSSTKRVPAALRRQREFSQVVQEKVVLLSITVESRPRVHAGERVEIEDLGDGFWILEARYGYLQSPHVPAILKLSAEKGLELDLDEVSFFISSEIVLPAGKKEDRKLSWWRARLFALMSRNAVRASSFFSIPSDRVIELGAEVEL